MLDYTFIIILLISVLIGLWRGFIEEIISISFVFIAAVLMVNFNGSLADKILEYEFTESRQVALAIGSGTILTLMVLLGTAVRAIVGSVLRRFSALIPADKLWGVLFGLARGTFLACLLVYILNILPEADFHQLLDESKLAPYFQKVLSVGLKFFDVKSI